jgi:formyltetrahydrofolate synthetase
MDKPKIDIKELTSQLKSHKRSAIDGAKPISQAEKLHTDRSKKNSEISDTFVDRIKQYNSRRDYQMDRFIYVDNDIHEVLRKIKSSTRLKISHLASALLEEFILKHKSEIQELLAKKQNKFLD